MQVERPRLTYLISSLQIGGAERGMARLLEGLVNDYDVTVVALRGGDRGIVGELPDTVRVLDLDIHSLWDVIELRHLCRELTNTDILVCSLYHAAVIGAVVGWATQVPAVVTWQHNERFENRRRRILYGLVARLSDQVLADSETVRTMIQRTYSLPDWKVRTVPIAGIDIERFAPRTDMNDADTTGDDGVTKVGILGRLLEQKNHEAVLMAADRLRDEPIRFEIAGQGPRESVLRDRARERGLKDVRFRGFVDNAPAFLNELDIYVQPSHYEGLCMTVLEAMACGLPVVGTAVGGLTETVLDGDTGYLVDPGDQETFVDRIRELHLSPKLRVQFGRRARERVVERYSSEILIAEFRTALNTI